MIENYLPDGRFVKTSDGRLAYFLGTNECHDIFLLPSREDNEIYINVCSGTLFKKRNELIFHPGIESKLDEVDLFVSKKIIKELKLSMEVIV